MSFPHICAGVDCAVCRWQSGYWKQAKISRCSCVSCNYWAKVKYDSGAAQQVRSTPAAFSPEREVTHHG